MLFLELMSISMVIYLIINILSLEEKNYIFENFFILKILIL